MPLTKVKEGSNMYQGWVTHTHSHLAGECPHKCSYCYVQRNRFGVSPKYKGEPRLIKRELDVNYGTGKTIFIEHMNDLFADGIASEWIFEILEHCCKYPGNRYVLQSKNTTRAFCDLYHLFNKHSCELPIDIYFGTTMETNRDIPKEISRAPSTRKRYADMIAFRENNVKVFVTIEPIMDFDVDVLSKWITEINPLFVNIGADSKGCNLPEPPKEKILKLIENIKDAGIEIKQKSNLARLLK